MAPKLRTKGLSDHNNPFSYDFNLFIIIKASKHHKYKLRYRIIYWLILNQDGNKHSLS